MDRDTPQFVGGLLLALLAAALMFWTDGPVPIPITLLIVGIVLIAKSRRTR